MDDLPAWTLQAAAEMMGYEMFVDVPFEELDQLFDLAESLDD
jgi:hypothetical protein